MAGEPIEAVRAAVKTLVSELKADPLALETVFLSVITFSSSAQQVAPLADLLSFQEPAIAAGGSTALGQALRVLRECIDQEVVKPTATKKGDWKPLIFLMTNGRATDSWEHEAGKLKQKRAGNIIAFVAGPTADENLLKQITETVVKLNDLRSDTLRASFQWVSSSIRTTSQSVAQFATGATANLPPPPPMIVIVGDSERATLPERKTEAPLARMDKVHFSVSSPSFAQPGMKFIVDVWAHLERQRPEVERRVQQAHLQTESPPIIRPKGPFKIERGTTLFVRLRFPDLLVEPPEDVILWEGEIGNASFEVAVPAECAEGVFSGLVSVHWEGGLQIAKVPLQIHVTVKAAPSAPTTQPLHQFRKAFASYANPDRDEVLRAIQGMQKILPDLDVFLDVVKLRSGEDWEKKLWQVIPESDVFYLFWSAAAKASPWVEKEWRCALTSRGYEFIDPVPLESPEEVRPPEELSKKHFNDWILAYRRGKTT